VRINSRYSSYFTLKRGVRQGDPLSCLLFNFSIEPLAIKLRQCVKGLSVPGLTPVKVMLYTDDVNLFLGKDDSIQEISACLTDVQPVAATLTKNVFLWLATFGQKIEIDPVAQLKIVKHH